jgi:hypothetical protein
MPCRGRWIAHSLTAGAAPQMRAGSKDFALGFSRLEPGPVRGLYTDRINPRLGPSGASRPRIWICSINACKFPVKGKTQNVVNIFVLRLFVVVLFHGKRRFFNAFGLLPSCNTLRASNCS